MVIQNVSDAYSLLQQLSQALLKARALAERVTVAASANSVTDWSQSVSGALVDGNGNVVGTDFSPTQMQNAAYAAGTFITFHDGIKVAMAGVSP